MVVWIFRRNALTHAWSVIHVVESNELGSCEKKLRGLIFKINGKQSSQQSRQGILHFINTFAYDVYSKTKNTYAVSI